MENSFGADDKLFTKMTKHIDKIIAGTFTSELLSPQARCTELEDAYENLRIADDKYTIIKSGYPIKLNNEWVSPYIIYMIKYSDNYWVMPIGSNNDFCYGAEIYTDY